MMLSQDGSGASITNCSSQKAMWTKPTHLGSEEAWKDTQLYCVICPRSQWAEQPLIYIKILLFHPILVKPNNLFLQWKASRWGSCASLIKQLVTRMFPTFPLRVKFIQEHRVLSNGCASSANAEACYPPMSFASYHATLTPGHFSLFTESHNALGWRGL